MARKISHEGILTLSCVFLMLFSLIQAPAFALVVSQHIEVNGTTTFETLYDDGLVPSEQVVYVNGIAYVNITYDDGSAGLIQLQNYINQQDGTWSTDRSGIGMDDVIKAVDHAADYRTGRSDYISENDLALLNALNTIAIANVGDFYNNDFQKLAGAVNENHVVTQNNLYEIEALYTTLEKMAPDTYCESRMDVVRKYSLTSVKCGLHSKICYNGNVDRSEGGKDFCIHTDSDGNYTPCLNVFGRCGTLESVQILDSEANSYTKVVVRFYNPGNMTLNPKVKIDVEEIDAFAPLKTFEKEIGEVRAGERKEYVLTLDNSGLEPDHDYDFRITLSSGRKDILEKIRYQLKSEGTFERNGTVSVVNSPAEYGKNIEINATYTNRADYAYSTNLNVEVFLNYKRYFAFESPPFVVDSLEAKMVPLRYYPDAEGNYTVFVSAEGQDTKERFQFEIKKPEEKNKFTGFFSFLNFLW